MTNLRIKKEFYPPAPKKICHIQISFLSIEVQILTNSIDIVQQSFLNKVKKSIEKVFKFYLY